jgi:cysteine desulfurase
MMKYPIYLDYNATCPLDEKVLKAMLPYFSEHFGNPASRSHLFGWKAQEAIDIAREQVAELIHANPKEIVFTSGATESNNLALKGLFEHFSPEKNHIITLPTEHKAILDVCLHLEKLGAEITLLQPDATGMISIEAVEKAIRPNTFLISIMYANNEIGTIQDIATIGALAKKHHILFHTDATQAIGKVSVDVREENIDLLSMSGHKLYGPKGIGALYVNAKSDAKNLIAQMDGGRHQRGFRSGTLNVPSIVGLGKACEIAQFELKKVVKQTENLRNQLEQGILQNVAGTSINGHIEKRLPNVSNISFEGLDGERLLDSFKEIAVSSGSACTSASIEPSHVLKSIGLSDELAQASIRFSVGKYTTQSDIDFTIQYVKEIVESLKL